MSESRAGMGATMKPAHFSPVDIGRVVECIDRVLELLERLGSEVPEEHLRRWRERLNRLRDEVATGANQIAALATAIKGLRECVEELKTANGRSFDSER